MLVKTKNGLVAVSPEMGMAKFKMSLQEIAAATGESLPLIHDAIKAGHLRTFVVGRRRFARPADVEKWVAFLQKQSDAGKPLKYRARPAERRARA